MLSVLIVELVNRIFGTKLTIEKIIFRFIGVCLVLSVVVKIGDWLTGHH